jgi:hypothetical protein
MTITAEQAQTLTHLIEAGLRVTSVQTHPYSGVITAQGDRHKVLIDRDGIVTYASPEADEALGLGRAR